MRELTWGDQLLRSEAEDFVTADFCRKGAAGPDAPWTRAAKSLRPPWVEFPALGRYFDVPGAIPTPALGSTNVVVLTINMPPGWDGVIRFLSWNYTGAGFVQGSGDILWTLRISGAVVEEYNRVPTEMGTIQQPRPTVIRIYENQTLEVLVSIAALAAIPIVGTQIVAYLAGWRYPRDIYGDLPPNGGRR